MDIPRVKQYVGTFHAAVRLMSEAYRYYTPPWIEMQEGWPDKFCPRSEDRGQDLPRGSRRGALAVPESETVRSCTGAVAPAASPGGKLSMNGSKRRALTEEECGRKLLDLRIFSGFLLPFGSRRSSSVSPDGLPPSPREKGSLRSGAAARDSTTYRYISSPSRANCSGGLSWEVMVRTSLRHISASSSGSSRGCS